jgi:hypothetical protein
MVYWAIKGRRKITAPVFIEFNCENIVEKPPEFSYYFLLLFLVE